MIRLSKVSEMIKPSLTRHLFNMAKEYDDVIDFTLGDPDVQTHQAIKDAGCLAIQHGKTRYSQNSGLLELREQISAYYKRTERLDYDFDTEISKIEPTHGPNRLGDIPHSLACIDKAKKLLGYAPEYNMRGGLKEAVKWYWKNL